MNVPMPRLSDSMEEGTIVTWLVEDGAMVVENQEIVEIETDKATLACVAEAAGILRIVAEAGTTLPLGAPIAWIESDGASADVPEERVRADRLERGSVQTPHHHDPARDGDSDQAAHDRAHPPVTAGEHRRANRRRVLASPIARRLAAERDVDLAALEGTGPGGRIMKRDVIASSERLIQQPVGNGNLGPSIRRREATRFERLVAERMTQSRSEIPDFTVSVDVDLAAVMAFRAELKSLNVDRDELPSITDLIVKACALQLRRHPHVNAYWDAGTIVEHVAVNIGVAVAGDDGGLIVPVIRDADALPLGALARTSRELIPKARSASCTPRELEGGTFTVSNLGMHGVHRFTAIITRGQGAILAVGAAHPAPVELEDGEIAIRRVVTLTLSSDHRLVYGAQAAAFLMSVKQMLEHPVALAL